MITAEYIMKDRSTQAIGRYQFTYDNNNNILDVIDLNMLLTVPEMADCVINEFTQQDREDFLALERDELIHFHHSTGQDIRNAFGLWIAGNPSVLCDADDTSMEVLELIWKKLKSETSAGAEIMRFK